MRLYLDYLAQSKNIVQIYTRLEPNVPFLARVFRVDLDTVFLLTYDIDTFEQWGEVVLNINDLYRIDLWTVEVSRRLFDKCYDKEPAGEG